jgi:hypothetical protein
MEAMRETLLNDTMIAVTRIESDCGSPEPGLAQPQPGLSALVVVERAAASDERRERRCPIILSGRLALAVIWQQQASRNLIVEALGPRAGGRG